MGMAERIKKRRKEMGYTQAELGEKLGLQASAIAKYENGRVENMKRSVIAKMADALECSPSYLIGLEDDAPSKNKDVIHMDLRELTHIKNYRSLDDFGRDSVDMVTSREMERVKQLKKKEDIISNMEISEELIPGRIYTYFGEIACAGTGFYFDDIPTETIEAPDMGGDFIIGVNGDSMEPDYHDGDKLYVKKTEYISHGDVGIFTIGNECFLKEFGEEGLISRNKDYEDIPGTEDIRLIGKVIGKVDMEN